MTLRGGKNVMENLKLLENFMVSQIVGDMGKGSLDPDEDLLEQGIIDSLGVMRLIVFMEDTFKVKIDDEEIIPENFQCLNNMATFIEHKIKNS
jgi:acyl carrier protein